MEDHEVEVFFCDLCGASVPQADVVSEAAIVRHGKTIGPCCLPSLRSTPDATSAPQEATASAGGAPSGVSAAQRPSSAPSVLGFVLVGALVAGVVFLELRLADLEQTLGDAQREMSTRQQQDSEVLSDVSIKLEGKSDGATVDSLLSQTDGLALQLQELQAAMAKRQSVLDQELDGLRRAVRAADDRVVDYRPLFEDLRQRHVRAIAVLEGLRDGGSMAAAALPPKGADLAAPPSSNLPRQPAAGAATDELPPDLAASVAKLSDADPAARFEAVDVLIEEKDPRVLPHLLPLAKDADAFVRRLTVEGLRGFRAVEVVDALIASLGDDDENVCDTAWRSLRDLTGQKLPFDPTANKRARASAAAKWQQWWAKARDGFRF